MTIETSSRRRGEFISNITPSDFFTNSDRVPRDIQLVFLVKTMVVFASGVERKLNDNSSAVESHLDKYHKSVAEFSQ
jgi:hypothetical protein